ncbi:MAG: GIY-YIG nuclease family protein [Acidobacteria bacterium]|nr:GIY-YIG nuclease family protein [Acidobacteriota bacterium]
MMDKKFILDKIKMIAIENGGKAPGFQVFTRSSGIQKSDWYPHIWLRWSDALKDAGLEANEFNARSSDDEVFGKYAQFVREIGRMPVFGELTLRRLNDSSFPSTNVVRSRGGMRTFIKSFLAYCSDRTYLADVALICQPYLSSNHPAVRKAAIEQTSATGYVYLMKSGKSYKIGHTVSVERREREIGLIIPNLQKTVHWIETDDPTGVEAYWHRRFADKRSKGEWFNLSRQDVDAFKRWKKIA